MDLFSHALMGGLVASAGLQKKYGMVAAGAMVAANLLPDMDSAATVLGPKYFFLYHRSPLTHSVGGGLILSAALSAALTLATPLKRPILFFAILFSGIVLHLLSDLLTPWPIPLLWPLSSRAYSLDLVNVLDLPILFLLGASFLSVRSWPGQSTVVVILTLALVAGYLGFRLYSQRVAVRTVQQGSTSRQIAALPHALSLTNWDVIAHEAGGYKSYVVDALRRQVKTGRSFRSVSDEQTTAIASRSSLVKAFLKRARFPVATISEHDRVVTAEWLDVHLVSNGGAMAGVRVTLNSRGDVVEERFLSSAALTSVSHDLTK